jgi:hypothetical protein
MPYTVRVSAPLARYLLSHPHRGLRRRLSVLRLTPFPPGSRSLHADAAWYLLARRFPNMQAFVYGTNRDAVVYTYEPATETLTVRLAIIDATVIPA